MGKMDDSVICMLYKRERQELVVDWMACTDMGGCGVTLNFLTPSCLYSK